MKVFGWVLAATLLVTACGDSTTRSDPSTNASGLHGELLVSAAASLTDAFDEVAAAFEVAHPGVDVVLNLGGSSSLREQILAGAPVDVFASANMANMSDIASEVAGEPQVFANNLLQIAVPPGNPAGITGLEDFGREELLIGLCAAEVPCGGFARAALEDAGVVPAVDTNEPSVRALLTKVEVGELDAGITYVTDVVSAAGQVEGVDIPGDENVVAEYPIAVLSAAPNPDAAEAYVAFVLSDDGREILDRYGFGSP